MHLFFCTIFLLVSSAATLGPKHDDEDGWAMMGYDATHAGRDHYPKPHLFEPRTLWSMQSSGAIEASAVLDEAEERVFTAGGSEIFAASVQTGKKLWGFSSEAPVVGSPALADGALFVGDTGGTFYAVEQDTGELRWKYKHPGGHFTAGVIVSSGLIIVGSGTSSVLAWDLEGLLVWEFQAESSVVSTPGADDYSVYVGDSAGKFYKLAKGTGKMEWMLDVVHPVHGAPYVHHDVLYFGTGDPDGTDGTQKGEVFKVDSKSGKVVWRSACKGKHTTHDGKEYDGKHMCGACASTPMLYHGVLTLGCGVGRTAEGHLWGLHEYDGVVAWHKDKPADVSASSPILQRDGSVIMGSEDGNLFSTNPLEGHQNWIIPLSESGGIRATVAVDADGWLFVGGVDGVLHALHHSKPPDPTEHFRETEEGSTTTSRPSAFHHGPHNDAKVVPSEPEFHHGPDHHDDNPLPSSGHSEL